MSFHFTFYVFSLYLSCLSFYLLCLLCPTSLTYWCHLSWSPYLSTFSTLWKNLQPLPNLCKLPPPTFPPQHNTGEQQSHHSKQVWQWHSSQQLGPYWSSTDSAIAPEPQDFRNYCICNFWVLPQLQLKIPDKRKYTGGVTTHKNEWSFSYHAVVGNVVDCNIDKWINMGR